VGQQELGETVGKPMKNIAMDFIYVLIEEARKICYRSDFEINVEGNVYALDSSTINLCFSVFWWAEFRNTKGGIKLHTSYDVKTSLATFLHISNAKMHNVNVLDLISYELRSFYAIDKANIYFKSLYHPHQHRTFIVTRAKDNMRFKRMYSIPVDKATGERDDQIGKLETYYPNKDYLVKLRRIKHYDCE